MAGYGITASCPACGGDLAHVTSSRPTATEASAVTICGGCGAEWQVLVRLCVIPRPTRNGDAERQRARRARLREAADA